MLTKERNLNISDSFPYRQHLMPRLLKSTFQSETSYSARIPRIHLQHITFSQLLQGNIPIMNPLPSRDHLTWMDKIKHGNGNKYQSPIKNKQESLMAQNIPIITLYILNHSHYTSHHDQQTGEVEDVHVFLPWHVGLCGFIGRAFVHAFVEEKRDADEESEGDNLDEEPG